MQVQYKLQVGENEFVLTEQVTSHREFFETMSFYSNLPKVGPNGETDLELMYRRAQGKYDYYSIVSKQAGKEFKFGIPKEDAESLFPKGWEDLYSSEKSESTNVTSLGSANSRAPKSSGGLGSKDRAEKEAPVPTPQAELEAEASEVEDSSDADDLLAQFGF